jgi:hypothetical protein
VLADGSVYATSRPDAVGYGRAQLRRLLCGERFRWIHVAFLPQAPRPILLALVRIENRSDRALVLDYSEIWDVTRRGYREEPGAVVAETAEGPRVLADLGRALRAGPPRDPPAVGLALELRFAIPPRSRRQLAFGHVAAASEPEAAALVRAFRGEVEAELARTAAAPSTSKPG